jgi:hypothetical protein
LGAYIRTAVAVFTLLATRLPAASINFGLASFDVLIPEDGPQLGINVLNFQNFTGAFALPPDFPVLTPVSLTDFTVTIDSPGGTQLLSLGTLAPGAFPSGASLQFASNFLIHSITLSGNLDPTLLILSGGGSAQVATLVTYILSPSAGPTLQAGVDLGVVTLETVSDIPEPASFLLCLGAITASIIRRRYS